MADEPSDLELLAAWRDNDSNAGQVLFERHFRRIYRFFETKCGPDADELVQQTFLACVRAKDQFRGESAFSTYLLAVARHQLFRFFETRRRDRTRLDFGVSSIAELAPTPRTQLAGREDRIRLLRALQELPVDQQMLLELHYWEDVEIGELARIFECPAVTIRSRLHRARNALRERMMKEPDVSPKLGETADDFEVWARTFAPRDQ